MSAAEDLGTAVQGILLSKGKLADLIVLDCNLFGIPPSQISEAKVLLTLLRGQPVHGDLKLGG